MSLFKRIRDVSMAAIHDLIDKAEDPVKMLNQYLRDMEDDIAEAEVGVAKQIAIEKRLKHQLEEALEVVEKRSEQAVKALEAGDENLARRALQDKKNRQAQAADYEAQYAQAKAAADDLRKQLTTMKQEFEKMKSKKESLVARAEAAKAQKHIQQSMSGYGRQDGAKGFECMSDKVLQLEAEAEASKELRGRKVSLDDELDALGSDDVEDELAALKAQVAKKQAE